MIKRGIDLFIASPSRLCVSVYRKREKDIKCCEVCKFSKRLCGFICKYRKAYYIELLLKKGVMK